MSMILGPLAERLIPVLQTPVEDIIYEVLDQKGLPTRAEVRELRHKLDRLEKTLSELTDALESLKSTVDEASEKATTAAAKADAAPAPKSKDTKSAPKKAAAKAPVKKAGAKICRVPGCEKVVRAKGFCGAHYQKFKRGTLVGWVGADGTTTHEEVRYRVGNEYIGQPVETSYEGDDVLFFLPESDGKRLSLKVNDVRID